MTPPRSEAAAPDLLVLSHLRWSWVWQRPQHLVSRFAASRRTWFVEEPIVGDVVSPTMCWWRDGDVTVGRLVVPGPDRHVGFDAPEAAPLGPILQRTTGGRVPLTWLYTPLARRHVAQLETDLVVYDVMDDLAGFKGASPVLRDEQRALLNEADLVFCGGRSLHAAVSAQRPQDTHLFPSGVETEHFAPAHSVRRGGARPVAGYVGVIDERLDLELVDGLARCLPDWEIRMVGPVAKIDPAELPRRPNLRYTGKVEYADLPTVLGGFDVALMPFALNEATRSISPTKTLEYLAAGLPVVSTRVPDVVADHGRIVALRDTAEQFAEACRDARDDASCPSYQRRCRTVLDWHHWDRIAARMERLVAERSEDLADIEQSA